MDLIIRLKRPRNVDPYEALVLASKRRKKDDESGEDAVDSVGEPTVLKFAGTLSHQDEDIAPHISKARDNVDIKSLNHVKSKDVIHKIRSEARKASKERRLKVVNMSRALPDVLIEHNYAGAGDREESGSKGQYTIVDVVHDEEGEMDPECTQVEEDDRYVYSLYFANSAGGNVDDGFLDSLVSVEPLETNSVLLNDYRYDDDINEDDDDDSNDENNWRNDYPDSDPDNDGQNSEGSMEFMMENIKLESPTELSSDDGEGDLPYGMDHDQMLSLGKGYAMYKARMMKELEGESDNEDYASEVVSSESDDA